MASLIEVLNQLLEEVELYKDLLWTFPGKINVGIKLTDTDELATLQLGDDVQINEGLIDPVVKVTLSSNVLNQIINRDADAFALGGRSHIAEERPINFEFLSSDRIKEALEVIQTLAMFFFTPGKIKIKELRPELAGEAHGARPIPIAYWNGLRSSWIYVEAGETLNKAGEKDPWPQAFILLKGQGKVIIGDYKMELQERTVVYIPPNVIHQVVAEKPVELLWIAWNAPMY